MFRGSEPRPLFIDFDAYTDGDADFKKELITLIIDNLRELQEAAVRASEKNDGPLFDKCCHRIKATLTMLDDQALFEKVDQLKANITNAASVSTLHDLCEGIIESLNRE
jgi:hypothetical protein